MKIGIIGAGFTGLTAAYELAKKGHDVIVLEKDLRPGGLAIGFRKPEWKWTLEKYYHHWFINDHRILRLAKELTHPVIIKRPKTSIYINGVIYQFDSPLHILLFPKLSITERLRMGIILQLLRMDPFWKPLEKVKAIDILPKALGEHAYKMIWEPQLKNKMGKYIKDISLAWFWARITKRTSSLAYPEGGFLQFAETLANAIKNLHGRIIYDAAIDKISETSEGISLGKSYTTFDKVIVTLTSQAFIKIAPDLPEAYKEKLTSLKSLGATALVLRLKKQFLTDNTYWLSICENNSPILGIFEHTNFMDKKYYDNEHIIYIGNYLEQDDPKFSKTKEELLALYDPLLKKINPDYIQSLIGYELFKTPFAQPIIPINYSKHIPRFETPMKNVYLANMQQVYPWDRGTNYAVELGEKIAQKISENIF